MGRTKKARHRTWPKIRRLELKTKTVWELDTGSMIEPRIRQKFENAEAAETLAEKLRAEHHNEGMSAFSLKPSEKEDARQALEVLRDLSASLKEAAIFYRHHHQPIGGILTAQQVFDEMLAFKRDVQKKRPIYVNDLKVRFHGFLAAFGARSIIEISSEELQDWVYSNKDISELTRSNLHRYVSLLFSFAQGKRDRRTATAKPYRVDNPMQAVAKPSFDRTSPEILTIKQAKAVLVAAHKTQAKLGMLPYVVLGMFCGIRAEELRGLQWGDVKLRKREVTVPARIAKKRRMRNVPIPANACSWLKDFADAKGAIAPKNSARKLAVVGNTAGLKSWPHNALRHSYGSYLFAMTENAQVTAARLGQKGDDVLFTHYRALASKEDGKAYFALKKLA